MRAFCLLLLVFMVPLPTWAEGRNCMEEIQRGVASWYGPGFEGALTKSEEPFDPMGYSAAHPTLPLGTTLKVTNLRNAKSVYVRVNDRGSFGARRAIDLSEAAAAQIGMIDDGTTAVALYECK